jgi:hypothetical protein
MICSVKDEMNHRRKQLYKHNNTLLIRETVEKRNEVNFTGKSVRR